MFKSGLVYVISFQIQGHNTIFKHISIKFKYFKICNPKCMFLRAVSNLRCSVALSQTDAWEQSERSIFNRETADDEIVYVFIALNIVH